MTTAVLKGTARKASLFASSCLEMCKCCRFGGGQQRPPRTVEVALKLTLKELYTGTTKRLKITRRVYNKQTGKLEPKEVCPLPPEHPSFDRVM